MNMHKNAKLTPLGRERMVKMILDGHTPAKVAAVAGVSPVTAKKWLVRYQTEGWAGLQDRSSRPKRLRQPTPARTIKRIIALRRQRLTCLLQAVRQAYRPNGRRVPRHRHLPAAGRAGC